MAKRSNKKKSSPMKQDTATVENPNWRPDLHGSPIPRFITATVNVFESAISTMASRKQIDPAQALAADRFRKLFEATGGAGAKALDYSKEPVDGGGGIDPIRPAQINAARQLGHIRGVVGQRNYDLLVKVCGEGHSLGDLFAEKRDKLTAADNLRASLDDACTEWGISVTANAKPRRKYWTKKAPEKVTYSARGQTQGGSKTRLTSVTENGSHDQHSRNVICRPRRATRSGAFHTRSKQ